MRSAGVVVIEENFRLGPLNMPVLFDSAGNPGGISAGVVIPIGRVNGFAAVIVVPKQIFPVGELLHEIGSAGMLDAPTAGSVRGIGRRRPGMAPVAAVGVAIVAVDGSISGIQRSVAIATGLASSDTGPLGARNPRSPSGAVPSGSCGGLARSGCYRSRADSPATRPWSRFPISRLWRSRTTSCRDR